MLNIIKNVSKILFKRKSYIIVSLVLPIIVTFIFTSMYTSNSEYKIGLINKDKGLLGTEIEKTLNSLDGIDVKKLDANDNNVEKLVFSEVSMIITIDEDYSEKLIGGERANITYKAINKDEVTAIVTNILETETKSLATLCNNIDVEKVGIDKVIDKYNSSIPKYELLNNKEIKVNVLATIGLIIYLIFISSGLAASFLLEDEREKTKDRILMGRVSEKEYYGAMSIVFFILTAIPTIEYYVVARVLDFEIGFENPIIFLMLLLLMALFAVVFSIMLSTIIKNKAVYGVVSSTLTIPIFMLSGAFWPFEMMGEGLQKVGSVLPIRWFLLSIEKLQQGGDLKSIIPMILALIVMIILMFFLSIFFTRNKIQLVKG